MHFKALHTWRETAKRRKRKNELVLLVRRGIIRTCMRPGAKELLHRVFRAWSSHTGSRIKLLQQVCSKLIACLPIRDATSVSMPATDQADELLRGTKARAQTTGMDATELPEQEEHSDASAVAAVRATSENQDGAHLERAIPSAERERQKTNSSGI